MRLAERLISNAVTTYLRLGVTFVVGLFSTWYLLGVTGMAGFGLIALATASSGPSQALERAIRVGLVPELAAAIGSGRQDTIRRALTCAWVLCLKAVPLVIGLTAVIAALAYLGVFSTPTGVAGIRLALVALIVGEGTQCSIRLLCSPYVQSLYAAQYVGWDNLLTVVARVSYALSAVLVFGWLLHDAPLATQLAGFAVSRTTVQLTDVGLGVWLARRRIPGLQIDRSAFDSSEYRSIRGSLWHSSQVMLFMSLNPRVIAILINLFFGVTYNAIWQIVVQLGGFARMSAEGLLRGIDPLSAHLNAQGRQVAVVDLMARTLRYQVTVMLLPAIFVALYAEPVLRLWIGGRLARDPYLAAVGISVDAAISLTATMAVIFLAAQVLRASFFGVERMLFGLGRVSSYSWFAKYAALTTVAIAAALFWSFDEPLLAPVALVIVNAVYFPWVILLAARREVALPVFATLTRSLPQPAAAGAVLCAALLLARPWIDPMTVGKLVVLLAAAAVFYAGLAFLVVPDDDERRRLSQLARDGRYQLGRLFRHPR